MELTAENIELLDDWWVTKSRKNFLAYRQYMRAGNFKFGWFIADLCHQLQQFYIDLKAGLRPTLLIQAPPQHGKSWAIADFIAWINGLDPTLRSIYASYSDTLGIRCNLAQQRQMDSRKYRLIFPNSRLGGKGTGAIRNTNHLEFLDQDGYPTDGQFRNTTCGGRVNGESLDLGIIDDAVKGREAANSLTQSQKTWEWFTDDFGTRFSDQAGLLVIMTRWTTHDIIARILEENLDNVKVINYSAVATVDEKYRKTGEPLFPELKTIEFLNRRKSVMLDSSWEALYQGNPTIAGGNLFKDHWWQWWEVLPRLKYKFITADTAQKKDNHHDYTDFKCWGYGVDGNLYLLDHLRDRLEAPELRREAEIFYNKHNTPRRQVFDPVLRGMYIEDKASGIGLIQELKRKKLKVFEVPRHKDKITRADDAAPYVQAGNVYLNERIPDIGNTTKEAREFPEGEFDDDIDNTMLGIEVAFITKNAASSLAAAMAAGD